MEKVFTNIEHVAWLREQARLKRPYWYGCYFNPCTEALLKRKARQYPGHYTAARMPKYRQHIADGQIAGDCVNGAIKGAVWSELGSRAPAYASHGCPDKSADGMFSYCKSIGMDWGPMSTMPELPGVAVRFAGHVGIYAGGGEVVEWRGFSYGCVVTKLAARKWTHWYRLPWTEYLEGGAAVQPGQPVNVGTLGARLLKRGCEGEDVRTLQELLMKLGYELPRYGADGDFGSETEGAVKAYQAANGLAADGQYGSLTHAELMNDIAGLEDEQDDVSDQGSVKKVRVTGGTVNVRAGAGTQYGIVSVVRSGALLEWVADAPNGWHAVRADGVDGWISPRYSEVVAE